MVAYAVDALAWCKAHLGMPYLAGGCRCDVPCLTQDCSGWCVAATRAAGLWIPCINSSGFARWGREANSIIPFEEAIHTPFALLIRGDNGGENGDGPKGHIVPCVGDGLHTYEEMGTAYGACIGTVFGRRWDRAIKVPGVLYGPKTKPKPIYAKGPKVFLYNKLRKGWWVGFENGRVDFLGPDQVHYVGGMVRDVNQPGLSRQEKEWVLLDIQDWGDRKLKQLTVRPYTNTKGERVLGYTMVATDNHTYVPRNQR